MVTFDKRLTAVLVGTAAVGAGIGLAYYLCTKERFGIVTMTVDLEKTHIAWLQEKADHHTAGDIQKALQAVITYCMTSCSDAKIEEDIFGKVRCNTCGEKSKVEHATVLGNTQLQFVKAMTSKHKIDGGNAKAMRIMLEYAKNDVEASAIFGQ